MKKSVWISMIVAGACILTGAVTMLCGAMAAQWDMGNLSTTRYETNEYEISEPYQSISVSVDTADVELLPSENGKTLVTCREAVKEKHTVEVRDGVLYIERVDTRKWYDHISFGFGSSQKITVYLPAGAYEAMTLKGSTGDVNIPADFSFESMDISISTSDVTCAAPSTGAMKIKASTGDIKLDNVTAGELMLTVSTGRIAATGITVSGDMTVHVSTGQACLTDVTCKDLTTTGNTGDITLKNVVAMGKISITRSTGDVTFHACDAAEITVLTDTGNVTGTLRSEKVFLTHTDTGYMDVPRTASGGICEITTDTGDIRISIQN